MPADKTAQPWERQPEESPQAYEAFTVYRDLGAGRSVDAAYRAAKGLQGGNKRAPGRWREWSTIFDWESRASFYDEHLAEIESREREKASAEVAQEWARRRAEIKETEYQLALRLIEKAQLMLEFPLTRTVVEEFTDRDGHLVRQTILEPARWNLRDVVRMFELASKLARLGAELKPAQAGDPTGENGDDGPVQWLVKLPPDVPDMETWAKLYKKPQPQIVEPETDKVM